MPPPGPDPAEAHNVALILHTSGTTSRPKIVPLTAAPTSAPRPITSPQASSFPTDDRALNVMPLFHIHGLIAGLAAPLSRGGNDVLCTPGFNALKFFAEMEAARPTWYTAVPTMHQAILTRAGRNGDIIARHPLRFVRSSSASLPPKVIGELEATFHAPVIEAYGMTEAAHQMACNPLNRRAQARIGRPRGGPGDSLHGRSGRALGQRRDRRGRHSRRQCHLRLRQSLRKPMPRRSSTAGSAPAIRASSTPRATSR